MSIQIGQAAPDFKLFNTEKKEISLSDFKGKNLVILFFHYGLMSLCFSTESSDDSISHQDFFMITVRTMSTI